MTYTARSAIIDDELRVRITQQLDGQFKGDIIGPDHAEYESARQVWNAMVDRRPGLILRWTITADVVAAVNVAREYDLAPSVRCGGHNVAGKGMSEGGLTVDLSGLREVPKYDFVLLLSKGRKLLIAMGQELARTDSLEQPEDIFFLNTVEARQALPSIEQFVALAHTRRSIRGFDAHRDVPDEYLEQMLEAARWAPSGGNGQP